MNLAARLALAATASTIAAGRSYAGPAQPVVPLAAPFTTSAGAAVGIGTWIGGCGITPGERHAIVADDLCGLTRGARRRDRLTTVDTPVLHNHRHPVSAWWSRREAESRCHCHQIGQGVGLHLPHYAAPVRLHGDLTNAKVVPDLLIQTA